MSESYPFFTFEDDEWVSRFGSLMDEIQNPEIELSATLVYFDKSRPQQVIEFLQKKFKLTADFSYLTDSSKSSRVFSFFGIFFLLLEFFSSYIYKQSAKKRQS